MNKNQIIKKILNNIYLILCIPLLLIGCIGNNDASVNQKAQLAYVLNEGREGPKANGASISICPVNSDGSWGSCTNVIPKDSKGIEILEDGNAEQMAASTTNLYISLRIPNEPAVIVTCPIKGQSIDTCYTTAFPESSDIGGVAVNNNTLYVPITNSINNYMYSCNLDSLGRFNPNDCSKYLLSSKKDWYLYGLQTYTISNNVYLYATDSHNYVIQVFKINNDGTIGGYFTDKALNKDNISTIISRPSTIDFYNNKAYITVPGNIESLAMAEAVSECNVNTNGSLTDCKLTGTKYPAPTEKDCKLYNPFCGPLGVVAKNGFIFVTNWGLTNDAPGNTVSVCKIGKDSIEDCKPSISSTTFKFPVSLVIK